MKEFVEINIDSLSSLQRLNLRYRRKTIISLSSKYANYSLEDLSLQGTFSYLNLDKFINLKKLSLTGNINQSFNLELFRNLSNQLEELSFYCRADEKTFLKLFEGCHFSNLKYLYLKECCCMKSLNKNFIDRFPMLKDFRMNSCEIETIQQDAFIDLKQAEYIDLSYNLLNFIGKNAFSNLKMNLSLDLSYNRLTYFDPEFIGLGNSVQVCLDNNKI